MVQDGPGLPPSPYATAEAASRPGLQAASTSQLWRSMCACACACARCLGRSGALLVALLGCMHAQLTAQRPWLQLLCTRVPPTHPTYLFPPQPCQHVLLLGCITLRCIAGSRRMHPSTCQADGPTVASYLVRYASSGMGLHPCSRNVPCCPPTLSSRSSPLFLPPLWAPAAPCARRS